MVQYSSHPKKLSTLSASEQPLFVVLSDIRSRENVGSVFRTADAAGVDKIFLCGITPKPPHEKISKTALGAENIVPWEYYSQAWRLLKKLNKNGYTILALEKTSQSKNIFEYKIQNSGNQTRIIDSKIRPKFYLKTGDKTHLKAGNLDSKNIALNSGYKLMEKNNSSGVVLVLGNEVTGISKNLMNYATDVLEIPMYGTKESLNVAVAFGIAIYALKAK